VEEKLEKLSVADALNAVRFAEVVVVLLDVENAFEEQDQRIADLVEQEGRAIVIAVNKWDLKDKTTGAIGKLREQAEEKLTQLKGVPLVAVSGLTGEGLDRLMQAIVDAYQVWNKRVATSALNRWFEHAVSAHPPPAVSGRSLRLNYITQPKSRPPSFVVFCTRADAVRMAIRDIYSIHCATHSIFREPRSASHYARKTIPTKAGRNGNIEPPGQAGA
jgi:GTP-binding protein